MKELLQHAIAQLDKLDSKLDSVDKTLVKQEENLREHMRRTELLESQHERLEQQVHSELEPVKAHIQQVKGVTKFLVAAIPIVAAILGALYKYVLT